MKHNPKIHLLLLILLGEPIVVESWNVNYCADNFRETCWRCRHNNSRPFAFCSKIGTSTCRTEILRCSQLFATSSDDIKETEGVRRKRGRPRGSKNYAKVKNEVVRNNGIDDRQKDDSGVENLAQRLQKKAAEIADANEKAREDANRRRQRIYQHQITDIQKMNADDSGAKWKMDDGQVIQNKKIVNEIDTETAAERNKRFNDDIGDEQTKRIPTLREVNKALDAQLRDNLNPIEATFINRDKGLMPVARDSMTNLLIYNHMKGQWLEHYSEATRNVVVVFGKRLIRDQVSVEYASRIRSLANMFKTEDFHPSLVCFCGGAGKGNHVSDADAGYVFFRHMCEAQGIDLDDVGIFVDAKSTDERQALISVTNKVKGLLPEWLKASPEEEFVDGVDRFGKPLPSRKKLNVHFTFVSTEYHLCNLNDIHQRSPSQSLLLPIEDLTKRVSKGPSLLPDPFAAKNSESSFEYDAEAISLLQRGVVEATWSFQHATYPYIFSKDPAIAYLGKCYLLAEKLMPMRLNMEAVIDRKEFFQRDNYLGLVSIRRLLVARVEELHKPPPELSKGLRLSVNNSSLRRVRGLDTEAVDVVLEGALISLSQCLELVRPAGLHLSSVPRSNWIKAYYALDHTIDEIRKICDPDRPLKPSEWGKLVDDEAPVSTALRVVEEREIVDNEVESTLPSFEPATIVEVEEDICVEPPDLYFSEGDEKFSSFDGDLVSLDGPSDDDDMNIDFVDDDDLPFDDDDDDIPIFDENSLFISLDD